MVSSALVRAAAVAAALCFFLGNPAFVAGRTSSVEHLGNRVTLSLDRTEIVTGEPIYLNVKVENVSSPLIVGNFSSRLHLSEGNDLEVSVQQAGELPVRYTGGEEPAIYASTELNLEPGETRESQAMLLYDPSKPGGYLFGEPGVYTLRATLNASIMRELQKTRIELPPTQITVRAPEGNAARAFELLNSPGVARALQELLVEDREVVEKIRKVAHDYPDTPYAPLARFYSAVAYYRQEPPQYDQAAAEFRKVLELYPASNRAPDSAFMLSALNTKRLRLAEAQDWYFFTRDAYPTYELLRKENPLASVHYYDAIEAGANRVWWLQSEPWVGPKLTQGQAQARAAGVQ